MKVALFASAFHPHVGGVEEHVRQIAHAYLDNGIKPVVLTDRWPRSLPEYEEFEGIPVYRLTMRTPIYKVKARISYYLTHRQVRAKMVSILKEHQIDLIHVHCVSSNGYYALIAQRSLNLPLVVTTHGERTMDANQVFERCRFSNWVLKSLISEADYVTACSQHTLNDVEQFFGASFAQRACKVSNGINLSDFGNVQPFSHQKPYILGVGRMVKQKGFDILIKAFAQAKALPYDLLLAGDGPERADLENLTLESGLSGRVKFLGKADRQLVTSLFQGCSFFVLPSRMEPQGIVNLEAMAAGKAVIASRVGGVAEIVLDNVTGILIEGESVEALSVAITKLSLEPHLQQQLGLAGRSRAELFDWNTIADQYLTIYDQILSDHLQAQYPTDTSK